MIDVESKMLTVKVAARRLGLSRSTLIRMIGEKRIHAVKPRGTWRIPASAVEAFAGQPDAQPAPATNAADAHQEAKP